MKIAICDDDKIFLNKIENILNDCAKENDDVTIIKFNSGVELLKYDLESIDILFIDIEMPEISGFDVLEEIGELNVIVIFVSNYSEKVYTAIKYSPFRFIRKKYIEDEVPEAIKAAKKRLISKNQYIYITNKGQSIKIAIEDIMYIESSLNNLIFITTDGTFKTRGFLNTYKNNILFNTFKMSHRSYLVNTLKIRRIEKNTIIMENGDILPLSRTRKEEVKNAFIDC